MKTMRSSRRNHCVARGGVFLIVVTLVAGVLGCDGASPSSSEHLEIWDWYDLHAVRGNPSGTYVLMNDLDSTTAGYGELAGPGADGGEGWLPVGSMIYDTEQLIDPFSGVFDGQGYEIRDLFVNRPSEYGVALFGAVNEGGIVQNIGVVDFDVNGGGLASGLVGINSGGTVSNSYATGAVTSTGNRSYHAGCLVGGNLGTVSNCHAMGTVTGSQYVGGLVGGNWDTVSKCYATGTVTGSEYVGGLIGRSEQGYVSNCYATGSVTGSMAVGGLVGHNEGGSVSNSYASCSIIGQGRIGGLVGEDPAALFGGNRGTVSNSYYNYDEVLINGENIITIGALLGADFDEWLANDKFLDVNDRLAQEDGYYLINDVSDFKQLLAFGQDDSLKFRLKNDLDLGDEPNFYIPYLTGEFDGNGHIVSNLGLNFDFAENVGLFGCLAPGGQVTQVGVENANITGRGLVGGLVGNNAGTVSNSYFKGDVTSEGFYVGGVVGGTQGIVTDSYASGRIEGRNHVGGVVGWNSDTVSTCCAAGTVTGSCYVGGVVGWNSDTVSRCYATGIVTGFFCVGGLVGENQGPVNECYSSGHATGEDTVGGLAGANGSGGLLRESYSDASVTGEDTVGGLVGENRDTVSKCYATGIVTGSVYVGGLVGKNRADVSNSFWDIDTTGGSGSAGGTGKTTAEMQDIATFTDTGWDIIGVASGMTSPAHIWNIVDGKTYPFLSWESVS
jgi:hypothetical protein